jgi:hypothetical protein
MKNLKEETLEHTKGKIVEYIEVKLLNEFGEGTTVWEGYLEEVLPQLDFEYDSGYGLQYIEGYIWYADGSWSDRREYDGSEWWEHQHRRPQPRR